MGEELDEACLLARADPARVAIPEEAVVDEHHLGACISGAAEELERRRDAGDHQGDLLGAGDLKAHREVVGIAAGRQQLIEECDDRVSVGHAATLPEWVDLPATPGRDAKPRE